MKNTLKVIIALLIFIIGIVVIDVIYVNDSDSNELNYQLSFLIDGVIQEYEVVDLTDEEEKNIQALINKLDYTNVEVDLSFLGDYKLVYENKVLIFDNNNDPYGQVSFEGKTYIIYIKELKETLLQYINDKELVQVYLFQSEDVTSFDFTKINLSNTDKLLIKEYFSNINELKPEEMVDLMVLGHYTLIVDGKKIYFDDLSGFATKDDKLVKMDNKLIDVLNHYIDDSNNDCCSCCPNLELDEDCIDACCDCNEGGVINAE